MSASEKNSRYLDNVLSSAHHLLRLIDELLDLSRIEAGKMDVEVESVPLTPLLQTVIHELRAAAEQKSLSLALANPIEVNVTADPSRLRQVLLNLICNAVKFTHEGGVEVSIEVGERVVLSVVDTGEGLEPNNLERIFTPFERVTKSAPGTGLGLAISRHLVTLMDGSLTAESGGLGRGSTFRLALNPG